MSLRDAKHWLTQARHRLWATVATLRKVRKKLRELVKRRHEAAVGSNQRATLARRVRHYRHRLTNLLKTRKRREREKARLVKKVKRLREKPDPAPSSDVGTWDGRQVAGWMVGTAPGPGGTRVNWLAKIKSTGYWGGGLYSGWRSPEYSESLCYGICGRPSCPGLCAGRSSNHSGSVYPGGAIDVVDWIGFQRANDVVDGPFTNNLPNDRPHRSVSGY